jgi:hypothetical protein
LSLFWFQETAAELEDAADEAAEEMESEAQPLTAPYVTNTLHYRVLPPPPTPTPRSALSFFRRLLLN